MNKKANKRIREDLKTQIISVIRQYIPLKCLPADVILFGSWGTAKQHAKSDVDVTIRSKKKLPEAAIAKMKEEFEEGPILEKIDLSDYSNLPKSFQEHINDAGVVIATI